MRLICVMALVAVLGEVVKAALEDHLDATEQRLLARLVDAADAKKLLEFALQVQSGKSK